MKTTTSFTLKSITAISLLSGDRKDIRRIVLEMSVFESILENSVSLELYISDSLNVFSNFPLYGYELIKISFKNDSDDEMYEKLFRVSSITKVSPVKERTISYILHAVSVVEYNNELSNAVSKTYKNLRISDIASSIAKEYLGIEFINLDPTKGLYTYTIPYYDAFTALNFLANRAIAESYNGALYFCYENRDGYSFRTLESAMIQPISRVFLLQPANIRTEDGNIENTDILSIQDYEFMSGNDIFNSIALGMYGSSLLLHSISRKKFRIKKFNYNERYKDFIHTEPTVVSGKYTKLGGTDIDSSYSLFRMLPGEPYDYENKRFVYKKHELEENRRSELPKELEEKNRPEFPSETGKLPRPLMSVRRSRISVQNSVPILSFNLSPKLSRTCHGPVTDLSRDRHELCVLERQSQRTALFNNIACRVTVSGTASCTVSDMVELRVPSPEPVEKEKPIKLDPHYSGRYMIVSARHFISQKDNAYYTAYECVKDSVVSPYPDA
jgi:hypothetical protein